MIQKLTLEATIPTVQYGNIKPTIELEGDSFENIRDEGVQAMKSISDMVAGEGYGFEVRGLPVNGGRTVEATYKALETLKSEITGTSLLYDKEAHTYQNEAGEAYLSGSVFVDKFYNEFPESSILSAMVKKYPGATPAEIKAMWDINKDASTGFGTAIHAALENYDKNHDLGLIVRSTDVKTGELSPNKALSRNPFLKYIVEAFHEGREREDVITEAFLSNDEFKICGQSDRVKIVNREKKILRIQDFKTDGDIHEKKSQKTDSPFKMVTASKVKGGAKQNVNGVEDTLLGQHWLQLSFYGFIAQRAGWTVEGLDVFWLNPNKIMTGENPWETFSHDLVDITEAIVG